MRAVMFWKQIRFVLTLSLCVLALGAHAATRTWDGGGGNPFWSTDANWVGDIEPVAGDDLVFPAGALQLTNNNDLGVTFNSITFTASGYLLQGAAINISNGVFTTHGSGTSRIHSQVNTATAQTWSVAAGGTLRISTGINNSAALVLAGAGSYVIDGVLSGAGTIERTAGQTFLENDNTFTGGLQISGGVVQVDDPPGGDTGTGPQPVALTGADAQLRGSGEVGDITGNMGRLLGGPSMVDPTLTTGDITLSFLLTYDVRVFSPTVASSLVVNGTVVLDNTGLDLQFLAFPAEGQSFVIISNDGADPVNGTFLNRPEGSTFIEDGETFRITYVGGDGNDVELIATDADLGVTKVADDTTPAVGQNVTYTITVTNAGPSDATNVTLTDILGAGLTYVSATPSQGSCVGAGPVTCNLGTINSGANATVTLVATASVAGPLVNTASVEGDDNDPNVGNNTDTETVNASAEPVPAVPTLDARALIALAVLIAIAAAFVIPRA
jgi:uncharacterized repeat protein (TIGR01451 family)